MDGEMLLQVIRRVTNVKFDSSWNETTNGKLQVPNWLGKFRSYLSRASKADWFVVSKFFGFHTNSDRWSSGVGKGKRSKVGRVSVMDNSSVPLLQCPDISTTEFSLEDFLELPWSELEAMLAQSDADMLGDDQLLLDDENYHLFLGQIQVDPSTTSEDQPDNNGVSSTTREIEPIFVESHFALGQRHAEESFVLNQQPDQLSWSDDDDD